MYGYVKPDRRSLVMGRISTADLEANYQDLAASIYLCESPVTITQPKAGLLGRVGFKREVLACPALREAVVERTIARIEEINNPEAGHD